MKYLKKYGELFLPNTWPDWLELDMRGDQNFQ